MLEGWLRKRKVGGNTVDCPTFTHTFCCGFAKLFIGTSVCPSLSTSPCWCFLTVCVCSLVCAQVHLYTG